MTADLQMKSNKLDNFCIVKVNKRNFFCIVLLHFFSVRDFYELAVIEVFDFVRKIRILFIEPLNYKFTILKLRGL